MLSIFWTMALFFFWVIWFWLLISVFSDIFRRTDLSGWGKAGWMVFAIVLPYLGVFTYLVTQSEGMAQRNLAQARAAQTEFDERVRAAVAATPAESAR